MKKYLVLADLWPDDAPGVGGGGGRGQDQLFEERKLDGGGIIGFSRSRNYEIPAQHTDKKNI